MPADDKLTPADPRDLADAVAFALRFNSRKRAAIAAERVVLHFDRAGFVVMPSPARPAMSPAERIVLAASTAAALATLCFVFGFAVVALG
jgi:hypothetical protein